MSTPIDDVRAVLQLVSEHSFKPTQLLMSPRVYRALTCRRKSRAGRKWLRAVGLPVRRKPARRKRYD